MSVTLYLRGSKIPSSHAFLNILQLYVAALTRAIKHFGIFQIRKMDGLRCLCGDWQSLTPQFDGFM